jgi:hypothetical protein
MGGWAGDWVGAPEERRTGRQARPQSPARTPGLVDPTVPSACRPSGERWEQFGGAPCAEPICGGTLPSHGRCYAGGARGGWAGCELLRRGTSARRRGGACVSSLVGAVAVHDDGGACEGGREGCCPTKVRACARRLRRGAKSPGECTLVGISELLRSFYGVIIWRKISSDARQMRIRSQGGVR